MSEGAIAQGVRRIGIRVRVPYIYFKRRLVKSSKWLKCCRFRDELDKISQLLEEQKALQKKLQKIQQQAAGSQTKSLIDKARTIGDVKVVVEQVEIGHAKDLFII